MGIRRVGGVLVRLFSAVAVALILPGAALADPGPTVSNGGYMQSVDAKGEAVVLPLKHTDVEADIAGTVASVKVTQRFHNSSSRPIEAVYVFPLPQDSAVSDFIYFRFS